MNAKGKIAQSWSETKEKRDGSGPFKKHFVILEGDARKYEGFGDLPDGWKPGAEVEFGYEERNGYFNIEQKRKGGYGPGFADVVKALAMPKVCVGYERTRQLNQFEPKKVSVFITESADQLDPAKIDAMVALAKQAVERELGASAPAHPREAVKDD